MGLTEVDEPFSALFTQGMVLKGGVAMSKSLGNIVSVDEITATYGADTARTFTLFVAPPEVDIEWSERGVEGAHRFLNRVWRLVNEVVRAEEREGEADAELKLLRATHKAIRKVTVDIERFHFNTAVSALMELMNALLAHKDAYGVTPALREGAKTLLLLLAPIAPHIAEELWARMGEPFSIHQQSWPEWSEELIKEEFFTLVVQVDGKLRDRLEVPVTITEEEAKELALSSKGAKRHTVGKEVIKVIYVPGKLVNIVTR
jgi:leucyl-tRNA synthetase